MKKALVCGAGGFIGSHLVNFLKKKGYWVRGVDLKYPRFSKTKADDFIKDDLRNIKVVEKAIDCRFDRIYQLAADMGGAGFVFTGENDAEIMHNSALINLNVLNEAYKRRAKKIFYSSSACIYPKYAQEDKNIGGLKEKLAYPAQPDSEYGWEKLFSEHLYMSYAKNKNMDIRIARFHNIFGEEGSWNDGREKVPAALCRKIALHRQGEKIIVWGDGQQTRSFLYIDECLKGIEKLMNSNCKIPINLGSDEKVSINELAYMIADIANKDIEIKHDLEKPQGVRGRNSDNTLIEKLLKWKPSYPLKKGLRKTYKWVKKQVNMNKKMKTQSLADCHIRDHLGL